MTQKSFNLRFQVLLDIEGNFFIYFCLFNLPHYYLETILCNCGLNLESDEPTTSETTPPTLCPIPTISGGIGESDDSEAEVVRKISAVLSFLGKEVLWIR